MDTAGQEEYKSLREQFMMNAEGFVLVYSVVSRTSFNDVKQFHQRIKLVKEAGSSIPIILVGNKIDLRTDKKDEKEVSNAEGQQRSIELGTAFIEASAKENVNVAEIFLTLLRLMNESRQATTPPPTTGNDKRRRCQLL